MWDASWIWSSLHQRGVVYPGYTVRTTNYACVFSSITLDCIHISVVISLAREQSHDTPSANEANLKIWVNISYEYEIITINRTKANHKKCIFYGITWTTLEISYLDDIISCRVTHICVSKLIIFGSDNGLSPGRRQAIIWTNAGILLIWPLRTNFSEISIDIQTFSFKKIHLKCLPENGGHFVSASLC